MIKDAWYQNFEYNLTLLDKIDLKRFIERGDSPGDIMDKIENAYEDHEFPEEIDKIVQGPILKGYFFNYIGTDDFMDYLHEKYNIGFYDEIHYWVGSIPWN